MFNSMFSSNSSSAPPPATPVAVEATPTPAAPVAPSVGHTVYEVNVDVDTDVAEDFKAWLRPHAAELLEIDGFESYEILAREAPATEVAAAPKPQVLFVLGGPGAGKGTQCGKITEEYEYEHISAGDCLRAERSDPSSENGALINDYIKRGAIVPVEITIALLLKAMQNSAKTKFLIDGFPRNANNLQGWQNVVGDQANVAGVLFFDCPEDVMETRLLKRGKDAGENARKDDNAESIRKRFHTYKEATMPIINTYDNLCMAHQIVADRPADVVFEDVKEVLAKVESARMPLPEAPKAPQTHLTVQYKVASRDALQAYFDVHAARLRGDGIKRFGGKMTASRRILKCEEKKE